MNGASGPEEEPGTASHVLPSTSGAGPPPEKPQNDQSETSQPQNDQSVALQPQNDQSPAAKGATEPQKDQSATSDAPQPQTDQSAADAPVAMETNSELAPAAESGNWG